MGYDFGGGPYSPPERVWRGFDRDGCPECGGDVCNDEGVVSCFRCRGVFNEYGIPIEADELEEVEQ